MPLQTLALILLEHRRSPFIGPVLQYGEQNMAVKYAAALWTFRHFGVTPQYGNLAKEPDHEENLTMSLFCTMLGLGETHCLDVSDYQGAGIVADLNVPVPDELKNKYGLIIDGGTMEHVFDIRQGMRNTVDMLKVGGCALHMTPSNNYFNHGFVQVSPTLYHDYYKANAFDDVRGTIVLHPRERYEHLPWKLIEYDADKFGGVNAMFCDDETQLDVFFTARKSAASTNDVIPIQSYYLRTPEHQVLRNYQFAVKYDPEAPTCTQLHLQNEGDQMVDLIKLLNF